MATNRNLNRQNAQAPTTRNHRLTSSLCLLALLLLVAGVLAIRATTSRPTAPVIVAQQAQLSLAKEYIYAGGRLIASVEPANAGPDQVTTIGLYRPSASTFYLRNSNTRGFPDLSISFGDGPNGDIPVAGDWDGHGTDTLGVYRPSATQFFLLNSNITESPDITVPLGAGCDLPVVGDWK